MGKNGQPRIPIVDRNGELTGDYRNREEVHTLKSDYITPQAHILLVSPEGKIGVQTRAESKKYLGGKVIPLSGGGHLTDKDILKVGETLIKRKPLLEIDYVGGVARELEEELRVSIEPREVNEFRRLRGFYDLTEHAGYPFKAHFRTFWTLYSEEERGKIDNWNSLEVEDFYWLTPKEIEDKGIHKNLYHPYAESLLKEINKVSKRVK